ncbi:MAG: hypothetical protein ACR2NP_00825, partial [Pirellulaceae bacterium]
MNRQPHPGDGLTGGTPMITRESNRRQFLKSSAGASAITLGGLGGGLSLLTSCHAQPVSPQDLVQLQADVEPLVQLIESTPRDKCFDAVAGAIRNGTSYRNLMAALYLAGIRNITSSHTGGPLHAVFVMHSAHQMSLDSAPDEQLLPMFWALDNFKATQERGSRLEKMQPFRGQPVAPEAAIREFAVAMDSFDADRAESAMMGMLESLGAHEIIEQMWQYGARDYRAIGHKAIYLSNGWRTLQTIGWQHAEPTMRHLARAMVAYDPSSRSSGFTMDEQSYNGNLLRARENVDALPASWTGESDQPQVVEELLAVIRTGDHDAACDFVIDKLKSGAARAGTIWDAVHLAAGEIVMRQATIRPVHAVTSANAIHYAFRQSTRTETRLLLLLQAAGWMCHFIRFIGSSNRPFPDKRIDQIAQVEIAADAG